MENIINVSMTLKEMRDLVYFLINEEEEDFPSASVNRAINEGLKKTTQITDHSPIIAEYNTQIGESQYSIPEAKIENNRALVDNVWIDGEMIFPTDVIPLDGEEGIPETFSVVGRTLSLYPKPVANHVVTVRYRKEFTPLVEDDDVSELSDEMANAAVKYACYLLKIKDEEFESADFFKREWDEARANILSITTGLYSGDGSPSYAGGL